MMNVQLRKEVEAAYPVFCRMLEDFGEHDELACLRERYRAWKLSYEREVWLSPERFYGGAAS